MTIQLTQIIEGERARTDYGDLQPLAQSIRELGLIQPIVLNRTEGGDFTLVAGGRRYRALQSLAITELHQGITCDPTRPGFVFAEDLTPSQRLEIELDENLQRRNMRWTEEVLLISRTHAAKQREAALNSERWGVRQSGALFKQGAAYISYILNIAELLKQNDPQILAANSVSDCIKILMQRREDEASALLAKASGVFTAPQGKGKARTGSNIEIDLGELEIGGDEGVPADPDKQRSSGLSISLSELTDLGQNSCSKIEQELEGLEGYDTATIALSEMFKCGDSIKGEDGQIGGGLMFQLEAGSVDHVVTDIPYGINMDNLDVNDQERVEESHGVADNVALMIPFLEQSYRVLKDNGYLVFWYDLDHHEKLMNWGEEIGFKVQHWPLVWIKTHPTRNRVPQFNFTKRIEYAMVMRKGKATLVKPQTQNYIIADGSVERKMYSNPFAKPFEVWKFIFDAIAIRGQIILDPYCGEMSMPRAAINCGLSPRGFELEEYHYNRGIEHIKGLYLNLTRNKAKFV